MSSSSPASPGLAPVDALAAIAFIAYMRKLLKAGTRLDPLNQGRGKADATVVYDGETLTFSTWKTTEPPEQALAVRAKPVTRWIRPTALREVRAAITIGATAHRPTC